MSSESHPSENAASRKSDLSALLKALSESLRDDLHSGNGSEVRESQTDHDFVTRLRSVIPKLLDAFIDPKQGSTCPPPCGFYLYERYDCVSGDRNCHMGAE
jgi:hypothetical protein